MIFIAWLATTMLTPAYIKAASRLQCVEDEAAFIYVGVSIIVPSQAINIMFSEY